MVFDGIKKLNKGDNAGGQNKNNATIWFYLYLIICGFYESVELNFMVPGHTSITSQIFQEGNVQIDVANVSWKPQ